MIWRPAHLADVDVVDVLRSRWAMQVDHIEYAPVGFGSYHWWVVADERHWFVTADDLDFKRRSESETLDEPRRRLRAALAATRALRDHGLRFVVAPVLSTAGEVIEPIGRHYALAVYPTVDGHAGDWGRYPSHEARLAVIELVAELHRIRLDASRPALVGDWSIR